MLAAKRGVIALLIMGLAWKYGHDFIEERLKTALPIKYVRTEGVFQHLERNDIKNTLMPLVMTGIFDADMQAIHNAVSTLPWVEAATVRRIWPDAIDIKVRERKPYARWAEKDLITEEGLIFTPKDIEPFKEMTIVSGPPEQQVKVLEIMKGVNTALQDQSLKLAEFDINERWAWKIRLGSGLEILLGRNEQLKKLQRFLKTLSVLKQEQIDAMAIVDLRYPNGYSVSWKPDITAMDWKAIATPKSETMGSEKGDTE